MIYNNVYMIFLRNEIQEKTEKTEKQEKQIFLRIQYISMNHNLVLIVYNNTCNIIILYNRFLN